MELNGVCAKCGKTFAIEILHEIPEIEAYERKLAMAVKDGKPLPPTPDTDALSKKYGVPAESLLCDDCLKAITGQQ